MKKKKYPTFDELWAKWSYGQRCEFVKVLADAIERLKK